MGRGAVDWKEANEMPASVICFPNRKDLWQWAELKQQLLWCHLSINWVSARSRNAMEETGISAQAPFLKCIPLPYASAVFLYRGIDPDSAAPLQLSMLAVFCLLDEVSSLWCLVEQNLN